MRPLKITLLFLLPVSIIAATFWFVRPHVVGKQVGAASIPDSVSRYHLNTGKVKLVVKKSDYVLQLYIDNKLVKEYPVVLGNDPVNDKTHEGDGCTPEGTYKIKAKYPHKSWTYFMWIDYPNEAAWKRFNENKKNGVIAKNATIGGEVGIHGVPFESSAFGSTPSDTTPHQDWLIDKRVNWTLGCISLKTADIKEIYTYAVVGTEVQILH
jgi:murein L,D-transpeptidase YafK